MAKKQKPTIVTANEFQLADEDGKLRAVLSASGRNGEAVLQLLDSSSSSQCLREKWRGRFAAS